MDRAKLKSTIINKLAKDVVETDVSGGEIWISPAHWRAMNDEKKAMVVDLYHREYSYNNNFPFEKIENPKNSCDVGITFHISGDGKNIANEALRDMLKELKIPHLFSTYDKIRAKKDIYIKRNAK